MIRAALPQAWSSISLLMLTTIIMFIVGLTPYNIKATLGCKKDPIYCKQKQQNWIFMFYDSNNSRQLSTFEYLIPGFAKELIYSREWQTDRSSFEYPPAAVIDCYTCPSLCQQISVEDLPLVLFIDSKQNKAIRYKGYVSLSGLISFIKTHDPKTSYLAEEYQPGELSFEHEDASQRQMNKVIESLNKNVIEQIEAGKQQLTFEQRMAQNQAKQLKQKQDQLQLIKQKQQLLMKEINSETIDTINQTIKQQIKGKEEEVIIIQQQFTENTKTQIQPKNVKENDKKSKAEKSKKQKKNNKKQAQLAKQQTGINKQTKEKQKKDKKKQSGFEQFISIVESSSKGAAGIFAEIGLGGFIIDIIEWIFYIFFFVLFGAICLLVQAI